MFTNLLFALAFIAVALGQSNSTQAGIAFTLSNAGANAIASSLIPILEAAISNMTLPPIPFSKDTFSGQISGATCSSVVINTCSLGMAPPDDLSLNIDIASLSCTADWSMRSSIWPHPSGSGSVDISVTSTKGSVDLELQTDSSLHLVLSSGNVQVSVGQISLTLHGSKWDWLLDLFLPLIEDAVKDALPSTLEKVFPDIVSDINGVLTSIPVAVPLPLSPPYNISEVRIGFVGNPVVNTSFLGVQLQGDVVSSSNAVNPPIPPPQLPALTSEIVTDYIQVFITPYTLASALYTYYSANLMTFNIPSKDIPLGFNETSSYSWFAPGFPQAYPNSLVTMVANESALADLVMNTSGTFVELPVDLSFFAVNPTTGTEELGFVLGVDLSLSMNINVTTVPVNGSNTVDIRGQLAYIGADITVAESNVGQVSVSLIDAGLDLLLQDLLIPLLNSILGAGINFPSGKIFGQNATINYYGSDGYGVFGVSYSSS